MKIFKALLGLLALLFVALFLLLLKGVTFILGLFQIGSVLYRNGKVLTPIIRLRHSKTGKRVVLIGVVHIGHQQYYTELQHVINSLCGYKVLYEGIGKITDEQKLLFNAEEKTMYENFLLSMKDRGIISELLKLQGQRDGLTYDESWIRTDMTLFEFITKASYKKLNLFTKKSKLELLKKSDRLGVKYIMDIVLTRMPAIKYVYSFLSIFSSKLRRRNNLIIDERNDIAVQAIFQESRNSNVISIWGAAHLPGMLNELKKAGFKQEEKHWFVAYKPERNSLKKVIQSMVNESD